MDGIYYTLSMEDDTGTYAGQSRNSGGGGNEEPTLKALERVINDMALVCDGERDLNKCFQPNIKGLGADLEKLSELLK